MLWAVWWRVRQIHISRLMMSTFMIINEFLKGWWWYFVIETKNNMGVRLVPHRHTGSNWRTQRFSVFRSNRLIQIIKAYRWINYFIFSSRITFLRKGLMINSICQNPRCQKRGAKIWKKGSYNTHSCGFLTEYSTRIPIEKLRWIFDFIDEEMNKRPL